MTGPGTQTEITTRRDSRRSTRLIARSRLSLMWQRLWPCLWQPLGLVGLFIGVALMDVLPLLPLWLHTGVLLGLCVLLCVISTRAFRHYQPPMEPDVIAYIERTNHLENRPLASLRDDVVSSHGDPLATRLWQEHVLRAAAQTKHLRMPLPQPELARHDPYALRVIVVLVLVIGVAVGHSDATTRLSRALLPSLGWHDAVIQVDVWVNPPAYTGHAPFHLSTQKLTENSTQEIDKRYDIPVGSDVLIQVGSDMSPQLTLGDRRIEFEPLGDGGFRADTHIGASDASQSTSNLAIRVQNAQTIQWPVRVIDDTPPIVDFIEEPGAGTRGRLGISFAAKDDYSLRDVSLVIHNTTLPSDGGAETILRLALPLPRRSASSINTSVTRDLSEHEWAGIQVSISLEARDAIGQIGRSGVIKITLPERPFNHPVARKLIEFRKMLNTPEDKTILAVISGLNDVSLQPSAYNHDSIAFLVMRVARSRLILRGHDGDVQSVRRMLWETALRIEDGEFAMAGRELSDAHDQLMEALQDGVYGDTIGQLLDTLREALDRFMAALSEQLAQKGLDAITDLPGMSYMDNADILSMLEDARELARTGSMEAAKQTLDELRALLDSVEAAMNSDVPMDQYNAAREMLEKLFNMTREQESLLDDTFRRVRRGQDPRNADLGEPASDAEEAFNPYKDFAEIQEALRQKLRDIMPELQGVTNQIPPPVIQAERSMQRSSQTLSSGKGNESVPYQSDALDALRRASEMLAQQMAQQLRGMPGNMMAPQGLMPNGGSDPFGRVGNGGLGSRMDDGAVKIPTQFDVLRAQEIFDELRNRAGDLSRPELEREYIQRLLQPF